MGHGYVLEMSLDAFVNSGSGQHSTGYRVFDEVGRAFTFAKFKSAPTKGAPCGWYYSGSVLFAQQILASSTAAACMGVVQGSGGAAGQYGWVQTFGLGRVPLAVTGSVVAFSKLYWSEQSKAGIAAVTGNAINSFALSLATKSGTKAAAGKYFISPPFA